MTYVGTGKIFRFQLHGRLDWQNGQQLQEQVSAIAADHYQGWVMDLSQVEFVDSSGLVALILSLSMAKEVGVRLAICQLRPSVRLVFDISKLDRAFAIFDTYEAAATYCQPAALTQVADFSLRVGSRP